jgi:ActR/RegA family two-component response regulator
MTAPATGLALNVLNVLVICNDADALRTFQQAVIPLGDRVTGALDLAEAIAQAASIKPEVAFVDVTLGDGTGLALVHHIQAVDPGIEIYVMAPSAKLHMALEGLTLGATSMLTLPTTGDAVLRAVGEVRQRRGMAHHRERVERELGQARRSVEAMQQLAKMAARGGKDDLLRAMADAIVDVGSARAASVYQPDGVTLARVASSGPVTAPENAVEPDLERFTVKDGRETFALGTGAVVVEGADVTSQAAIIDLTTFGSHLLALAARGGLRGAEPARTRFEPLGRFQGMIAREVENARRHGRKVSVAAILFSDPLGAVRRPVKLEEAFRGILREGDVLGRDEGDDEVLLLLPDTGALGAQLCRRRIGMGAVGLSTFPQDANSAESLMVLARKRAELSLRSPVRMLDLGRKSLRDIVDALLACPLVDAGPGSPYPLDVVIPSALELVHHTCIEARRAGDISVLVTARQGIGFSSAVREACSLPGDKTTVMEVELRDSKDSAEVDAIVVTAEHGAWVCCGVLERDRFKAVHAADGMLADLVARKLAERQSA